MRDCSNYKMYEINGNTANKNKISYTFKSLKSRNKVLLKSNKSEMSHIFMTFAQNTSNKAQTHKVLRNFFENFFFAFFSLVFTHAPKI